MAGGTAGAIKAGQAFVELYLDDNKLVRGMAQARTIFFRAAAELGKAGAKFGAAGAITLGPFIKPLFDVVQRGSSLQLFADKVGESVESLSALAHGFEVAGGSIEEFEGSILGLKEKILQAAQANGPLLDELRTLGLGTSLEKLNTDQLFDRIAAAMDRVGNSAAKLHVLRSLGLEQLAPYLARGTEGLRQLREEGAKGVLSGENAAKARSVMVGLTQVWQDFKMSVLDVGLALLPTAAEIMVIKDDVRKLIEQGRGWLKNNKSVIVSIVTIGGALAATGTVLTGLGTTFAVAGLGIGGFISVLGLVKVALVAIISPAGLVTAAIGGIGYIALTQTRGGARALAELKGGFQLLAGVAGETWAGMKKAAENNDWTLSAKIAMAGLRLEWANVTLDMTQSWIAFKERFVDVWVDAVAKVEKLMDRVSKRTVAPGGAVGGFFKGLLGPGVMQGLQGMSGGGIREGFVHGAPGVGEGVVGGGFDEEEKRKRDAQRANDLAQAEKNKDVAQKEFDRLRKLAEAAPIIGGGAEFGGFFQRIGALSKKMGKPGSNAGLGMLADQARGVFQGPAAQALGYGDTLGQRQLDAMNGVMANTAVLPQLAKDLNQLANAAGRFGR